MMRLSIPQAEALERFLRLNMKCSNVAHEVPVEHLRGPYSRAMPDVGTRVKFGTIPVVGGLISKDDQQARVILHCLEYVYDEGVATAIGALFWHKFGMHWDPDFRVDELYLYLVRPQPTHEMYESLDQVRGFCSSFYLGLLEVDGNNVVTEVLRPANQCGLIGRTTGVDRHDFADQFFSLSKRESSLIPDEPPPKVKENSILRHVFKDWEAVRRTFKQQ